MQNLALSFVELIWLVIAQSPNLPRSLSRESRAPPGFCIVCELPRCPSQPCIQVIHEDAEEHRAEDGSCRSPVWWQVPSLVSPHSRSPLCLVHEPGAHPWHGVSPTASSYWTAARTWHSLGHTGVFSPRQQTKPFSCVLETIPVPLPLGGEVAQGEVDSVLACSSLKGRPARDTGTGARGN